MQTYVQTRKAEEYIAATVFIQYETENIKPHE